MHSWLRLLLDIYIYIITRRTIFVDIFVLIILIVAILGLYFAETIVSVDIGSCTSTPAGVKVAKEVAMSVIVVTALN